MHTHTHVIKNKIWSWFLFVFKILGFLNYFLWAYIEFHYAVQVAQKIAITCLESPKSPYSSQPSVPYLCPDLQSHHQPWHPLLLSSCLYGMAPHQPHSPSMLSHHSHFVLYCSLFFCFGNLCLSIKVQLNVISFQWLSLSLEGRINHPLIWVPKVVYRTFVLACIRPWLGSCEYVLSPLDCESPKAGNISHFFYSSLYYLCHD